MLRIEIAPQGAIYRNEVAIDLTKCIYFAKRISLPQGIYFLQIPFERIECGGFGFQKTGGKVARVRVCGGIPIDGAV